MEDNLKGKRLLLLGSNVWRDVIKRFANEYGVKLVFAGKTAAPLDEIADESYRVDSIDHDAMKAFIREHNIDGVYMGGSELIISHACQYLNELSMPCYCTKQQWDMLQNKANLKNLFIQYGLPVVPRYAIDPNHIIESVPKSAYPVITKPTDGSGSNGFSVCHNPEELLRGYKIASENSYTGEVICEKFVKNEGLVVFFSFTNGKMVFTLAEDKYPVRYEKQGSYVAGLFLCESAVTDEFRKLFEDKLAALFKNIGINEGTIWIEVFRDGNNYYFNESGYRYGGSFSFYTVNYFRDINQVYADLYYALTGKSKLYGFSSLIPESIPRGQHYCIYPIHVNPGTIASISGIEELRKLPNVVIIPQQKEEGDEITDSGSFGQVVALVHFTYHDTDELRKTIDDIHVLLHVKSTNNEEMINRRLDIYKINIL